jgi:ribosomal protein S18 acetylase RimI-like enzyme
MDPKIEIRCLVPGDISSADRLRGAAGWNQTLDDWRRMVALDPAGCFVATEDGEVAGTATTTSYGVDVAWIGMVLVDPARRNRGIGRRLLLHCIEYLRAKGVRCIKLDATPAGQILYEKLGFEVEWPLARWVRDATASFVPFISDLSPGATHGLDAVVKLDREAMGVARPELMRGLWQGARKAVVSRKADGSVDGFGMLRGGVKADYLGPMVACDETAGRTIAGQLLAATRRDVYWDIPARCAPAVALVKELGFSRQRSLVRMHLGANERPGEPSLLWGISDPATG